MPGRFRFRLEVVRRVRRQAQDEQRRVVADVVQAVAAAEQRVAGMTQALAETIEHKRGVQQAARLDVASLRGHQFYKGWLQRRILESHAELSRRRVDLDRARARLGEVTRQLKVIEKLREKQWVRHQAAVMREEQAAFDELALQAHLRRERTEG